MYSTGMNEKRRATGGLIPLLHAAGTAQAYVEARLGAANLSYAKLLALSTLMDAGESLTLSQLAERLSCVKSNITQLVDRLEADGLVARQAVARTIVAPGWRWSPPAGQQACKDGRRIQQKAEQDLLKALTGDEARQLAALMVQARIGRVARFSYGRRMVHVCMVY